MAANVLKPVILAALFLVSAYYVSYVMYKQPTYIMFLTAPLNISVEAHPLLNLYMPALIILSIGLYLKNVNRAFIRKCSLRSVVLISFAASYLSELLSYYKYGAIPLGTSVLTLSFVAAFIIAFETFIRKEEGVSYLYSRFLFSIVSVLFVLLLILAFMTYFIGTSYLVHAVGLTAFLLIFLPYYERTNIISHMVHNSQGKTYNKENVQAKRK